MGDLEFYLDLIPSQHRQQPNLLATMTAVLNSIIASAATVTSLPANFDIDLAIGSQLDVLGLWIGQSRELLEPLVGVYFSFDNANLGFDQGTWQGPFDPDEGLVSLDDTTYRLVLRAKIGSNHWDGTVDDAYMVLDPVFATVDATIIIQDNDDMSMDIGILGEPLTPVVTSLLQHGFFDLKPVGVRINGYFYPSFVGAPFFGFDVQNDVIAGFEVGAWAAGHQPLAPGQLTWDSGGLWDDLAFWA
jgi:hypothetical protein